MNSSVAFDEISVSHGDGDGIRTSSNRLQALYRHIALVVRRNLLLIAGILLLSLVAAAVVTMLQTPKYTASATLEIANQSQQVLGEDLETGAENVDNWDADRFLTTQLEILLSRSIAERVAQRLGLYSDPKFFATMQAGDPSEYTSEVERRNAVIDLLSDNFSASLPLGTRIANLSFTSTDPKMSADITNAFGSEFIQANLQRRFDSSSYARNFVEEQLQEARARLETSENELNDYARQSGLIRTRDANASSDNSSSSVTTSSLMQLNEAANRAQADRVAAEAVWQAESSQPLLSSPAALSSPTVQNLLERRDEIRAQLDSAEERYFPDHPSIQRLNAELDGVQAQLQQAALNARNAVRAGYVAAQAAENRLRSQVNDLQGATLEEQARSVRYNTLAREADTNRSIYEGLLQRYRELNASAGITASNVSVIDNAEPPIYPSSPNLFVNLALGLLFGCSVVAVLVYAKSQFDDKIALPDDVEQKVGMKLLGVIPIAESDDPLAELDDPKSPLSEAYGALRSTLLYSTAKGLPHSLVVTSAQAGEGKSTTSFAIATRMARIGKRTVLVDADLRRPVVHRATGIPNSVGLSDILTGQATLDEAIVATSTENFSVIPSGPIPINPGELISSPRLVELVEELKRKFDFVLIDSAPVLGLADAPALAGLADEVIMVIEAERAHGGQLKAAVRRLHHTRVGLLGAVLAKFNSKNAGGSYSNYYYSGYYEYKSADA